MVKYLVFIFVFFHFVGNAQEPKDEVQIKTEPKIKRHELTISPLSIWFNKGFFVGHHVNYRLQIKRGFNLELESNGTLISGFDRRARQLKEENVFPLLNQSTGMLTKDLIGKGKTINRNKQKRFISSVRLGYHFFQHSTPYQEREYWAIDSNLQQGLVSIRSFQSHSISAGFGFRVLKYKRVDGRMKQVAAHKWSLDYLGSVQYQLSSYSINTDKFYDIQNIPNPYSLRKSGGRLNYRFSRYINSSFGVHFGAEVVYVPFLSNYSPNSANYVPRGGEGLKPVFTNLRVGVSFVF